ncbi:MAG: DUF1799 domain-containing protein [Synechococcaceae cyanobacterium]
MDYLLRGESKTQDLDEAAKAFGVIIAEPEQSRDYLLWAEHEPALDLFMRSRTQLRTIGELLVGLDYSPVFKLADLYHVADLPSVMEDLQVIELHYVDRMNARLISKR